MAGNKSNARGAAYLAASLLAVIRQRQWADGVASSMAAAVQDSFLEHLTSAEQIELKNGQVLVMEYDYTGLPNGFSIQLVFDEDRAINLGNSDARRIYVSHHGKIIKQIDPSRGDFLQDQSARIANFLNE